MNWLESIIYGFVIGFSDLMPISSFAHSAILLKLFGESAPNPITNLFVHIAILLSILQNNRILLEQAKRQRRAIQKMDDFTTGTASLELRFLKNAVLPMFLVFFLLRYIIRTNLNLAWVALFSVINGILLFSQGRMMKGNKDARALSGLDSILAGLSGGLFVFSGISRISAISTVLIARGIDKNKAASWTVLLSIPAILLVIINDLLSIFASNGISTFSFLNCLFAAGTAYFAALLGIRTFKRIAAVSDFSGFAYYSWGVSLFSFILYLTIV